VYKHCSYTIILNVDIKYSIDRAPVRAPPVLVLLERRWS
jgi:hypothetical protein